ncbi:MAG TPA: hypothetical protein VMG08_16065 [Allosphingosinicella sp.]|nr:hypothetical protein [Allosphingosinicella sp.]
MTDAGATAQMPAAADGGGGQGKKPGLFIKVLLGLGALQAYNIVTRHQDVLSLSQSIHLIVEWWRYVISLPFLWLDIRLPLLHREILALLLFFGAAANAAWLKQHGHSLIRGLIREARSITLIGSSKDDSKDKEFSLFNTNAHIILGMIAMMLTVFLMQSFFSALGANYGMGRDFHYGATIFVATAAFFMIFPPKPRALEAFSFILQFILLALFSWIASLMIYWRPILNSLKYLLLVLAADVAFRFVIDPMLAQWPEIPRPPIIP